jgi:cytochrome c553
MPQRRRWIRIAGWMFAALAGMALAAWAGVHMHTERVMQGDALPPPLATLPTGDAARGKRLGQVLGCSGCHGEALGGEVFMDIPRVARLVAPNLTTARARYDEAAFLRLMRAGTKADGRVALVMPNKAHQRLTDQELADLWAFIHAAAPVADTLPATQLRPLGRIGVVTGQYDIDAMRADPPESPAVLADRLENHPGRRLLQVACGECHGVDLAGSPKDAVPPLVVLKGYTPEQFLRLMHAGKAAAGVDTATGFMSRVARHRFTALTEAEVREMKAFIDGM